MPPARPGALARTNTQHRRVHPAVQRRAAGNQPLTRRPKSPSTPSRQARRRRRRRSRRQARAVPLRRTGARRRAAAWRPPPVGLTVAGEVQNYVPVTDAMLRNPDPGDWLMIRRDYHASNYSPLNQITRDNVKDLRLQWVWAMNEGGTNQPAPHRAQRRHLSQQPGQHDAGDRRRDRRTDLGKPLRSERQRRRHARHRHLRGQDLRRHQRRAPDRASTREPARPSGRRRSAIARRATTATAAVRSSPRAR